MLSNLRSIRAGSSDPIGASVGGGSARPKAAELHANSRISRRVPPRQLTRYSKLNTVETTHSRLSGMGRFDLRAGGKGHRLGLLARLCTYPFQSRNESDPGPALLFWSPRQRSLRYAGAAPSELLLPADLALRRDLQP